MKILAFESSAKAASTALLSDGLLLAEYTQNSGQTHSRTLMQMAKDMLTSCDLTPQDIGAVAVRICEDNHSISARELTEKHTGGS